LAGRRLILPNDWGNVSVKGKPIFGEEEGSGGAPAGGKEEGKVTKGLGGGEKRAREKKKATFRLPWEGFPLKEMGDKKWGFESRGKCLNKRS